MYEVCSSLKTFAILIRLRGLDDTSTASIHQKNLVDFRRLTLCNGPVRIMAAC